MLLARIGTLAKPVSYLSQMFRTLRAWITFLFLICNTIVWCIAIYSVFFLKIFVPIKNFRVLCDKIMESFAENWISGNNFFLNTFYNIHWNLKGLENLKPDRSYLVSANHQSWTDIVVLQIAFNRRIPFLRFFIKQELVYVPLLGWAWQALNFPRMKRYSKEYLARHPEKRGEDLATTRKTCERLRGKPMSILNFLEGTRYTEAKHDRQQSPFKNLLKPKTGGLAFVIECMGDQFHSMLDVTIFYPQGVVTIWQLLSGKLPEVILEVREVPLPKAVGGASYLEDEAHRGKMQNWVQEIWQQKDERLSQLKEIQ